ncbi:hypothetical protein [Prolixibacter denitrificans]|nr:hypothetical protein [Prolixibacter denitrificans]
MGNHETDLWQTFPDMGNREINPWQTFPVWETVKSIRGKLSRYGKP